MKHTNPPKRLQDLNLMDRFLFCEAIENAEAYKIILEIVLDKEINLIGEPIAENEKRKELLGKIARLDVCAIGDDDRVYNAEVQKVTICRRVPTLRSNSRCSLLSVLPSQAELGAKRHVLKHCTPDRGLTSGSYFAGSSLPTCTRECVITAH